MLEGYSEPIVSIVIPVYNVKDYLKKCVESVLAQTLHEIEVILVDDGSTDGSGDICDDLASCEARVRVIHQNNQGLSSARNCGISYAEGEYITFLDSDDYWDRAQALEEMINMIQDEEECVDCVLFSYKKKDLKDLHYDLHAISPMPPSMSNYQKKIRLLRKRQYCNSSCTKLYRRKFLFENRLLFPLGKKSEDLIFSQMVLIRMKKFLIYHPPVLVYQINRIGSITTSFSARNYEDIIQQMKQAIKDLKQADLEEQRLGMAYWAEQMCWFLGYLPQSGKPLDKTLSECEDLFPIMREGLSIRTKLVSFLLVCLGKKATVRFLYYYLLHH